MRLSTYLSDGMVYEIISVATQQEAKEILKEKFNCAILNERVVNQVIYFYDPQSEPNLWAQGENTDHLGGLIAKLEIDWKQDQQ